MAISPPASFLVARRRQSIYSHGNALPILLGLQAIVLIPSSFILCYLSFVATVMMGWPDPSDEQRLLARCFYIMTFSSCSTLAVLLIQPCLQTSHARVMLWCEVSKAVFVSIAGGVAFATFGIYAVWWLYVVVIAAMMLFYTSVAVTARFLYKDVPEIAADGQEADAHGEENDLTPYHDDE